MAAHAILGASGAKRWMSCPGSIRASEGMPNTSSSFAKLGTAAHELAEDCLREGTDARARKGDKIVVEGEGFFVDDDMIEAVQLYLDTVREEHEKLGGVLIVEHKFALRQRGDMFGTNDAMIVSPEKIVVFDYKHGQGVPVEVKNNPQLMYYALGALQKLEDEGHLIMDVELVVVQPRCPHVDGPVRRWEYDAIGIEIWGDEQLMPAAAATEKDDAPLKAGDHCQFCPAGENAACSELANRALEVARLDFADIELGIAETPNVDTFTITQLAEIAKMESMVQTFFKAALGRIQTELEHGRPVKGWKLKNKRGRRVWVEDEGKTRMKLMRKFKLKKADTLVEPQMKSPAQIEKLLKKEQKEKLKEMYQMVSSGHTLTTEDDPSPAVQPTAISDFNSIPHD